MAGLSPRLRITAPTGATLTASFQSETITLDEVEEGVFEGDVTQLAPWTVAAVIDGETLTTVVNVDDVARIEGKIATGEIYGASWVGTANTAWERTDAAADFPEPVPYVSGAASYGRR